MQLGKLGGQFSLVVQILVLGLVDLLKLVHHIADDGLLCFQQSGEVFLQDLDQFLLIHRHGVGAAVGSPSVVTGADPAYIGVFIGADGTPERPAALLTLDEGREQVLIALPLPSDLESTVPGVQDFLCLLEGFIVNDAQLGLVHHDPVSFVPVRPLSGEEVRDLLLAIDDLPGIQLVSEDMPHSVLAPLAVAFGLQATLVEHIGNLGGAVALLGVPVIDLPDDSSLLLVDGQVEVVADGLVVAVDDVWDTPLLGVQLLAELHPLGGVGTLLLSQRTEDG